MPQPNVIKYSTSVESNLLKKGNFYVGVSERDYGPSNNTGFYNGINSTNYITYIWDGSEIRFNEALSNEQLLSFLTERANRTFSELSSALVWASTQSNLMINNRIYESIVSDGLVLNLDAGHISSYSWTSSSWYDLSSSSLTASLQNGTFWTNDLSGYMTTDGINGSISIPNTSALSFAGSVDFSCEVWIKFDSYKNTSVVLGKGDGGVVPTNYNYLFAGSSTSFYFVLSDGSSTLNSNQITPSLLPIGTWGNVVCTLDSTKLRIYLNGREIGTAVDRTINPISNNNPLYISSDQYSLDGQISIARIYNKGLTAGEVMQNYKSTYQRFMGQYVSTVGLQLYLDAAWKGSYVTPSNTWYDISGNGYSGTLTNGATYSDSGQGSILFSTDDYVSSIGTVSSFSFIQNTMVYTISTWVKVSSLGLAIDIAGNNDRVSSAEGFYLAKNSNDSLSIVITNGSSNILNHTTTTFFEDTEWLNIVCVGDGSVSSIYRNGILYATASITGSLSTGESQRTLDIGRVNNNNSNYWDGNIANFLIYNRALTSSEVFDNYFQQVGKFTLASSDIVLASTSKLKISNY